MPPLSLWSIDTDNPKVSLSRFSSATVSASRAAFTSGARFGAPPRVSTSSSGSTSLAQLVEAGLGYAIVPQWSTPRDHPDIRRIVLRDMEPVRVYFAHTAFLGTNGFIRLLHGCCRQAMASALRA